MLAEVLIFVPSIARFRADFLTMRLEKAQIASLAQLAAEDMVTPALEKSCWPMPRSITSCYAEMRFASWCCPHRFPPISDTFDLREAGPYLIRDAFACLLDPDDQIIG